MRRTLPLFLLACSLQPTFGVLAADKASVNRRTGLFEPPTSDLRRAAERGDRAELSRAAIRLGPARLARLLGDPDKRLVSAALEAVPLLDSGALLLQPIAALLTAPDDALRARAVTATAALFAQIDRSRLAELEVEPEIVLASCQALSVAAANEGEKLSTRLSAMQGLVDAGPACANHRRVDGLLASPNPDMRRAAVLALPASAEPKYQELLVAASKDSDVRVAAAAAARLCNLSDGKRAALPALRDLVLADAALAEDVVEILPCLLASTDPAEQKAATRLAEAGRPAIREAIKLLRESRASRPVAEPPKSP